METFLFFMSGLTLGIAVTYTYYDAKAKREQMDAMFSKLRMLIDDDNINNNEKTY